MTASAARPPVIDYDVEGYDYRRYWDARDYEQWAEARVIRRMLRRFGRVRWMADFGGGYGRNSVHYQAWADRSLLIDYSLGNLQRAADMMPAAVAGGSFVLMRADLYRLPLVDRAVDAALSVRVLHHLVEVEDAIAEMGRVVAGRWILDVPIKHHLGAQVRALMRGGRRRLTTWEPLSLGTPDRPYANYHINAIRHRLRREGWRVIDAASVNNFRRWDRVVPESLHPLLRPVVYGAESMAQVCGRGWWGPSQFLAAQRAAPRSAAAGLAAPAAALSGADAELSQRVVCPQCRRSLEWTAAVALCTTCPATYPKRGQVWDFTGS